MDTATLKRIEAKLGLKLPTVYRKLVLDFPEKLLDWPPLFGETTKRQLQEFLLDEAELMEVQNLARKRLGKSLPTGSFAIGKSGRNYLMIDTNENDGRLMLVTEGGVIPCWNSLTELLAYVKNQHKRRVESARALKKLRTSGNDLPDQLLAEAKRLSRPAVLLISKRGKEPAAIWRGVGVVPPPAGDWEHWISIKADYLPQNPAKRRGVISIYLCHDRGRRYHQVTAVHSSNAKLPAKSDGTLLYPQPFECLPTDEVLVRKSALAIDSQQPDNSSQVVLNAYQELLFAKHPFFGEIDAYAMLGGCNVCFQHCYGGGEYPWELCDQALTVLTLKGEPWLEVFDDGRKFTGFSRIT